jgi:PAS domain S-box-containing protein
VSVKGTDSARSKKVAPQIADYSCRNFFNRSEMGKRITAFNWAKTSLGPISEWPQSLSIIVNFMLDSPLPLVLLWGKDGYMIYNDPYADFAGGRHPMLLGEKVVEGWPEVADFNRNIMKQGLAGKSLSYKDQTLTLYRNGKPEEVSMNLNYSPVMGEYGKPEGVMAIVVETTERVVAEQQRQHAEAAYRDSEKQKTVFFETALDAILTMDERGKLITLNPAAVRMFGYSREDAIGKELASLIIPPKYQEKHRHGLTSYIHTGKSHILNQRIEILAMRKDGSIFPVELTIAEVKIGDQRLFTGTIQDISERSRAAEKLRESEARFRALVTTSADVIYRMSPDWSEMRQLDGRGFLANTSEPDRNWLSKYIHPNDQGSILSSIRKAVETKSVFKLEHRVLQADGNLGWTYSRAVPILDAKGNIIEWFGAASDITEEKRAQEEQQKLIAITEQRNALLKVSKAKDEFIALASHQLRTPATTVKQYINLLLNDFAGPISPLQTKYLQTAYENNERELNIITDLLKTAQLDSSNAYQLNKQSHDIVAIMREAIADFKATFEQRHQTVAFSASHKSIGATIDATEIKLVFANLLENASKYSHAGTEMKVRVSRRGDQVDVSVADKGVGISKEDQQRVFDKFTRVDNELSDTVNGTGLGLYWVKQIVQLHNGSITLTSTLGKGSKFTVRLPRE